MDQIIVRSTWDPEAEVWVATSEQVPGLITEAETTQELERKLCIMIPELLRENGMIRNCERPAIPFHLHAERDLVAQAC